MLFSNIKHSTADLATCKHVVEILVGSDRRVYSELAPLSTLEAIKAHARTVPDMNNLSVILDYGRKVFRWEPSLVSRLRRDYGIYLLNFREDLLPMDYLAVPEAENAVRDYIENSIRSVLKVRVSQSAWTEIFIYFRRWVAGNSCNFQYDPNHSNLVGWLVSSAKLFLRGFPEELKRKLTSVGLNQEREGQDFVALDFQHEEVSFHEDMDQFDALARNLYKVSDFAYRHNSQVYYDMFSRYKFKKLREKREIIDNIVTRAFGFAGLRSQCEVYDVNFKVASASTDTATLKLKYRDTILGPLDPLIEGKAGLAELKKVMDRVISMNRYVVSKHPKDKAPLFDAPDLSYTSKDAASTEEKLEMLYHGSIALKKFLDFLKSNNINVFSVSSLIFQDERYIKRFKTFRRYVDLLETTERLINEEIINPNKLSNDKVYDDLMYQKSQIVNNISLKNLRDVIDNLSSVKEGKKPVKIYNELNGDVLEKYYGAVQSFSTSKRMDLLTGRYADSIAKADTIKKYFLTKGLLEPVAGKWRYVGQSPTDLFNTIYAKDALRLEIAMNFSNLSSETGPEGMLGYLRTMDFIRVFLLYVSDVMKRVYRDEKGNRIEATSKFRVFLILNEEPMLFNPPKSPSRFQEFSDLLDRYDFEYYLGENTSLSLLNDHLVRLYNLMHKAFLELMDYLRELYNTVYLSYSEGVILEYNEESVVLSVLKSAGTLLYHSNQTLNVVDYPYFQKFLNFGKIDESTGFIRKNGVLYREVYEDTFKYVHESGIWIAVRGTEFEDLGRISKTDYFGG